MAPKQRFSFRFFFHHEATAPNGPGPPHYRVHTITFWHATLCRTPLEEWSARRRDLYLTTHNIHKRQISMTTNPQSQQASGRKPTPSTSRPLEPDFFQIMRF